MTKTLSKAPVFFGGVLILLGLCCNEFFINSIIFPDAPFSGNGLVRLRVFYIALMALGVLVIYFRRKSFLVSLSKNMLLLFTTITIVCLVFELMFSFFIGNISVGLARFIPFPYRIVSQSSKTTKIPDSYIAIFGDSHAIGAGDWYLDTDPMTRDPYHVAHLLHKALGQDVLSFGMSGASSLSGMIAVPINNYRLLAKKYDLKKPEKIVVYFYAGNDVTDNLADLKLRKPSYFDYSSSNNLNYKNFSEYIDNVVIAPKPNENIKGKLIGLKFLKTIVDNTISPEFATLDKMERDSAGVNKQNVNNQIIRRNKKVNLPEKLQSPALELNQQEWQQGLKVFVYSLRYMQSYFNDAEIYVVYLPSVLGSYEFYSNVSAQVIEQREEVYSAESLKTRSDSLQAFVKSECQKLSIDFIDTREVLQEKGTDIFIHGPKDWKHFNKIGYELIAAEIAEAMRH